MSHYTVLVIGDNPEEQLEPFWELDLPKEDLIKDKRAVFEESFKVEDLEKEFLKFKEKYKEDLEKGEQDYWLKYRTCSAKEWLESWSGDYLNNEETAYGYYANPNSKWDWYSLGGRWTGAFKLKVDCEGKVGKPGLMTSPNEPGTCDQAKKGDIDFSPDKLKYDKAITFWELKIEDRKPKNKTEQEMIEYDFYKKEYYLKKFKTKENYAKLQAEFSTFAVLKDGEWYESGSMGWFGCNSATPEEEGKFKEGFYDKFIKELPGDTLLSVYDCHI